MDVWRHRVARGTRATGLIPQMQSCISQDSIEHFQRWGLGVIDVATMVPPRSDIRVERTGELAFESGEDAACVVLEMGTIVHDVRDAVDVRCRALFPRGQFLGKAKSEDVVGLKGKGEQFFGQYMYLWRCFHVRHQASCHSAI